MRTIIVKVPRPASWSAEIAKMREWLDAQGYFPPKQLICDVEQEMITIRIGFSTDWEAEAFMRQFNGSERYLSNFRAPNAGRGRLR